MSANLSMMPNGQNNYIEQFVLQTFLYQDEITFQAMLKMLVPSNNGIMLKPCLLSHGENVGD